MRFVLALLAILTMLASPAIVAAKAGCNEAPPAATSGASMPGMATMNVTAPNHAAAPCRDPGASKRHGRIKDCAQACAAMANVAVAATPEDQGAVLTFTLVTLAPSPADALRAHEPGQLDRPPKHLA